MVECWSRCGWCRGVDVADGGGMVRVEEEGGGSGFKMLRVKDEEEEEG